jgi:hypothetical protein
MAPLNVKAENKPIPLKQPILLKWVYRPFGTFDLDLWSKCAKGNVEKIWEPGFDGFEKIRFDSPNKYFWDSILEYIPAIRVRPITLCFEINTYLGGRLIFLNI